MKHSIKKYFALAGAFLCLGLASCGSEEPKKETPIDNPDDKLKGTIELNEDAVLMSLGESVALTKLFKDTEANFSKLTLDMSEEDVLEVRNHRLKAVGTGELTVTFSYGDKEQTLSVLVADCAKPIYLDAELCKKYVWDYEKSPKKIVNETKRPLIFEFWATWCGPCRTIAPVFERMATQYNGKVLVLKVDLTKYPKDGGKNWAIYDSLYLTGIPQLEGMFSKRPDGKTEIKLPATVLISKGNRTPELISGKDVVEPITSYMQAEFDLD